MNIHDRTSRVRVCCLVFLVGFLLIPAVSLAESSSPDELYRRAVEKHLQFKDRQAIELLEKLLEVKPDHRKARDLLEEMGVEVQSPAAQTREDEERDTDVRTTDSPREADTEPPDSDAGSGGTGGIDPGDAIGGDAPEKQTTRPDTTPAGSAPQGTRLEESDTSTGDVSGNPNSGGSSADTPSDPPPFRRIGSTAGPEGSARDDGPTSMSPAQSRLPNLNTTNTGRFEEVIGPELASRVSSSIADQGYYMDWEDLAQRQDLSERQLRDLRNKFRLEVPVLNVNTSSAEELSRLPYLDQSLARRIVNFRFTYGRFTYFEELLDVPGFTESNLNNVRPYLKLR